MADVPFRLISRLIRGEATSALKEIASTSIRFIKFRVQQRGRDKDGALLRGGRGAGKYSASYEKYRKKRGRETSFVNLTFTGKMMANLKPLRVNSRGTRIDIGFSTPEERKKARENTERSGEFVGHTDAEIKTMKKILERKIGRRILTTKKVITIK